MMTEAAILAFYLPGAIAVLSALTSLACVLRRDRLMIRAAQLVAFAIVFMVCLGASYVLAAMARGAAASLAPHIALSVVVVLVAVQACVAWRSQVMRGAKTIWKEL
jgi:predicted permease